MTVCDMMEGPPQRRERSNYAAMLQGPDDLRFEQAPVLGLLEPDHVRIEIKAVGICGTDVHLFHQACRMFNFEYTSSLSRTSTQSAHL